MTDGSGREGGLRIASLVAVALVAAVFLLSAAPRDASAINWLKIATTGKDFVDANERGKGLKKRLGELMDVAAVGLRDAIAGDDQAAERAFQGSMRTMGRIALDAADPTYGVAEGVRNRAKSAARKIKSFVGGAREAASEGGERLRSGGRKIERAVVNARLALAVNDDEKDVYGSKTGILDKKPLPAPASAKANPAGSASKPWFKDWVLKQQEEYPHCWGIVDANSNPDDCMAEADDKRRADAKRKAAAQPPKAEPEKPGTGKTDWASGDWKAEGTGWSGWDRSDSRYDDEDRESARVGIYALECWGVPGVTADSGLYSLMKGRMARNECPEEDAGKDASDDDEQKDYDAAVAGVFGKNGLEDDERSDDGIGESNNSEQDDYSSALARARALEEESKISSDDHQAASSPPDKVQEETRVETGEVVQEAVTTEQPTAPASNSGGFSCKDTDPRVAQAMLEAQQRGKNDHEQIYCAAVNIGRALIWWTKQCLERDRNLTSAERSQLESQIALTRRSIGKNSESARLVLGARANCSCWSQICAD